MHQFQPFLNKTIEVELSGKYNLRGLLLDVGNDLIVLFNGEDYIYIPLIHVQNSFEIKNEEITYENPTSFPIEREDAVSVRSILTNSKGMFSEIQISGHQSVHGYVTTILSDYFVFYSPVYKTMFIPITHLKWLIPYHASQTPYSLMNTMLPVNPSSLTFSRSFELQLQKLIGQIVVFDLGTNSKRIGQLKSVNRNFVELITAKEETTLINLQHIKSVHF